LSAGLLFLTSKKYLGLTAGIATSAIYVGMFFSGNHFTSQIWSPAVLSVPYVIGAYLVLRIGIDRKKWAVISLIGLSSFCGQVHFSGYSLSVIAITMALLFQVKIGWKGWVAALSIFIILLSPYIITQFNNGFQDFLLAFEGLYQRYLFYNFKSEEVPFKNTLQLRRVWFKEIGTSIFGVLQNTPNLKVFNISAIDITISRALYLSSYFIVFLFSFAVLVLGYNGGANLLRQEANKYKSAPILRKIKIFINGVFAPLVNMDVSNLSYQQVKHTYMMSVFVAITAGTGIMMIVGPNIQIRYVAWALPLVSMGCGLAMREVFLVKNYFNSKSVSFFIIVGLPVWMLFHSIANTVVYSFPSPHSLKYSALMEVLTTATQEFGLTGEDIESKVLLVDFEREHEYLATKYAAWTAVSFLTQQLRGITSGDHYDGCLLAIDTGVASGLEVSHPNITKSNFLNIWKSSIKRNPHFSPELISGLHTDWIRSIKNYIYVGYRLPNGNCFKNLSNRFKLNANEILAQTYANELENDSAITLPKESAKNRYVIKYRGQKNWSPVVFLLELSHSNGFVSAYIDGNRLRGYNGIDQNEMINLRLIFTSDQTGKSVGLPFAEGGIGFYDKGAYILPFTPWRTSEISLPPGKYQIRLESDAVYTLGGRFPISGGWENNIGGFSIDITDRFVMDNKFLN
jgi:hypothetical protein